MGELRRSSKDRQEELINAALDIIATRGIAALSTRSLAEHVGLSSGAIFRHFPSLDALLEGVVAQVERVLDTTYPPSTLPPRERLESFVAARSSAIGNQVGILRLFVSEQFSLALPKEGSLRLSSCVEKTRLFVLDCLREGQKKGELRADIDAVALAPIVMGTMQMLALSTHNPKKRADDARAVRNALSTLIGAPGQDPSIVRATSSRTHKKRRSTK